jgi:hypothetical protein
MSLPHIELLVRREEDFADGRPDFSIWAGEERVGRLYRKLLPGNREGWFWGLNGVFYSMDARIQMSGHAESLEAAKSSLREAFGLWSSWIMSLPVTHPSAHMIDQQLRRITASDLAGPKKKPRD